MSRKPSDRSKSATPSVELNLTPFMDALTSILIFMLLTSTGLVQMGVINVNAPRYVDPLDQGPGQDEKKDKEEKQLNLTIGITYEGIFIAGVGGVLGQAEDQETQKEKGPTIPLLKNDPECQRALANNTPPGPQCYDYGTLTQEMVKIKNVYPKETKVIVYAQPDVPYEILVNVMDATRELEGRALFYNVVLSPEIG
jgi:biopolymer transport protein ExbD